MNVFLPFQHHDVHVWADDKPNLNSTTKAAIRMASHWMVGIAKAYESNMELFFTSQRNPDAEFLSDDDKDKAKALDDLFNTQSWHQAVKLVENLAPLQGEEGAFSVVLILTGSPLVRSEVEDIKADLSKIRGGRSEFSTEILVFSEFIHPGALKLYRLLDDHNSGDKDIVDMFCVKESDFLTWGPSPKLLLKALNSNHPVVDNMKLS
ncbi:hypothetical protein DL765_011129 [Monosporascus sp. GIB2]|nr:hypothetical protein DL765_011129 [Monosporascus sp. GIB2]